MMRERVLRWLGLTAAEVQDTAARLLVPADDLLLFLLRERRLNEQELTAQLEEPSRIAHQTEHRDA